jgi:CheY-like chemotaxis protein
MPKILVAEDVSEPTLAKHILEACGAAVAIANSGTSIAVGSGKFFDCILMDVQMPEMDGIKATQCIRQLADPAKALVPIIALTANVHRDDIQKYREAGMNDYLAKPFDESALLVILRNQLYMNNGKNNPHHSISNCTTCPVNPCPAATKVSKK